MSVTESEEGMDAHAGTTIDSTEAEPLSRDAVFHLLQNERRRRVLRYISDRENPIDMRDAAEQVAAWEHDTTVRQLDSDERQRVYIALYQSHLPKLDKHDVIDYNQSRGVIERNEAAEHVERFLAVEPEPTTGAAPSAEQEPTDVERPWPRYYVAAALASVALLAVALTGVVGAFTLPAVGMLTTATFGGLSAIQYLESTSG